MEAQKSELITKICNLNLEARYYRHIIERGQEYYNFGKIKTVFSPKQDELIAIVEGNEDYVVFFELKNRTLDFDCTCKYQYTCKHEVATMIYIKDHQEELHYECSLDNAINNENRLDAIELYSFISRLVGPDHIVVSQTRVEFEANVNRLISLLLSKLSIIGDKTEIIRYLFLTLNILSTIKYYCRSAIDISIKISGILNYILKISDNLAVGVIPGFIKALPRINIKAIVKVFTNYEVNVKTNFIYLSLINQMIDYIQTERKYKECLESLIVLKAKYLYNNDQNDFFEYGYRYLQYPGVKSILFKKLAENDDYTTIINLWDNSFHNEEDVTIYIKALVNTSNSNIEEIVLDLFIQNPTFKCFEILNNNHLFNERKELVEKIVVIIEEKFSVDERIDVFNKLNLVDELYKLCNRRGMVSLDKYIDKFLPKYNDELLDVYQKGIYALLQPANKPFETIIPYLNSLNKLFFGEYYSYNVISYVLENNIISFNYKYQLLAYQRSLKVR